MTRDHAMQRVDDEIRLVRQRKQTALLQLDIDIDDQDALLAAFDAAAAASRTALTRWLDAWDAERSLPVDGTGSADGRGRRCVGAALPRGGVTP